MSVSEKTHFSTDRPNCSRTDVYAEPETAFGVPRDTMSEEAFARYFVDRERAERDLSRSANHPKAAEIHSELADHYEALALVFGAKQTDDPPAYS